MAQILTKTAKWTIIFLVFMSPLIKIPHVQINPYDVLNVEITLYRNISCLIMLLVATCYSFIWIFFFFLWASYFHLLVSKKYLEACWILLLVFYAWSEYIYLQCIYFPSCTCYLFKKNVPILPTYGIYL